MNDLSDLKEIEGKTFLQVREMPFRSYFTAKLFVSNWRSFGCLRIEDEQEE